MILAVEVPQSRGGGAAAGGEAAAGRLSASSRSWQRRVRRGDVIAVTEVTIRGGAAPAGF